MSDIEGVPAHPEACQLGAVAFHLNSGEMWTVAENFGDHVIIRSPRGNERLVSVEYWLGEGWADG